MLGLRLHVNRRQGSTAAGTGGRGRLLIQCLTVRRRSVVNEIRLVGQRQLLLLLRQDRCLLQLLQLLGVHGAGGEEGRRLQPANAEWKSRNPISKVRNAGGKVIQSNVVSGFKLRAWTQYLTLERLFFHSSIKTKIIIHYYIIK